MIGRVNTFNMIRTDTLLWSRNRFSEIVTRVADQAFVFVFEVEKDSFGDSYARVLTSDGFIGYLRDDDVEPA